ncbi:hypothetical protein [Streptomyces venezuelae]|uniref:hypothetical protein n=1 Tax=Streptomyces venezuelae TaxID=54571 RepID=UPI0037A9E285
MRAAAPAPHPVTGPGRSPNPFVRLLRGGAEEPPPWAPPPSPPVVLTDRLFDSIGQALEAVDGSFLSWAAEPPGDPAWHEDDDLVEVLHGLLSAAERGSPDMALAKVVSLRDKLRLQRGMETVVYDPCDPSHTALLFAFTAPAAPGLPGRCRAPALVHGARVLRRGTVLPPPVPDGAPPAAGPFPAHTGHPPAPEPSLPPPPGHPRPLPPTEEG